MNISKHGIAFIKTFEALRLSAYDDGGGVLTIGYGHTGPEVKTGDKISAAQAETFLRADLLRFESTANAAIKVAVTQNQYDMFISILFNVGSGKEGMADGIIELKVGGPSTLLAKLNAGDYLGAGAEFIKWHKDGGKRLKGLLRRRVREISIWLED